VVLGMTARRAVVPAMIILIPWASLALPAVKVPRAKSGPFVAAVVVSAIFAVGLLPMASATGELDRERFPTADVLARLDGTKAFYDDAVGGFLILERWPTDLVWIDDRAELHGAERLSEMRSAMSGLYEDVFERYEFDAALAKHDWALVDRLQSDGWTVDYETEEFVVLIP